MNSNNLTLNVSPIKRAKMHLWRAVAAFCHYRGTTCGGGLEGDPAIR